MKVKFAALLDRPEVHAPLDGAIGFTVRVRTSSELMEPRDFREFSDAILKLCRPSLKPVIITIEEAP